MKKYIFALVILNTITINFKFYAQTIENCDDISIINGIKTIHGVYHLHVECEDNILITSLVNDQNGTIINGFLDSPEIQITPGDSFVRIIPENTRGTVKHKTRLGNGGVGTRQNFKNTNYQISQGISLYPNPTKNNITINTKLKIKNIELYNSYAIKQTVNKKIDLKNNIILNLENYNKGIYILKIHLENNQIITKTIVKQ